MFKRLLIANRGEIAVRIIRACQELGIETVAVYSEADKDSLHVQLADYAYCIGPAEAALSYMNKEAIVTAAQRCNADAIHPGYGFLSENADFAQMVTDAGFTFIGPCAATIRMIGNKDAAKEAMKRAGVPVSPGSDPFTNLDDSFAIAKEIGYPVILKPVAGGGGKGMFVAHNQAELIAAVNIIKHADHLETVYFLEKYIVDARHIEVQIVADHFGHIVHLGERECSLQRRNQKLLEECPSSAITSDLRRIVGELAIKAVKSIHYTNIGTVEFLMDQANNFYFMEINPRIQVEHGITEMVTGVDLVIAQLQIAAGQALEVRQKEIRLRGHAIECRINAEDPAQSFFPCPGQIGFYHQPGGLNVRIDTGVYAGYEVQPYYDSLIAKVIVHGRTRGEAIKTMQRALSEMRITGIKTTIDFHKQILEHPLFCSGNIDIQFIQNRMIS